MLMRCPGDGLPEVSEDLITLPDTAFVRHRPGMYIGGTDARGLHYMLFELVNESLAAGARTVSVTLGADGAMDVADDRDPPPEVEFLFTRLATLHSGAMTVVANALSERLTLWARTPGSVYQHNFRRGATHAVLQSDGPADDRGLTVRFRPDPDIFGAARFDPDTVRDRLRQCAFLHSGVRITFTDETAGTRDTFGYADGIAGYVRWLNSGRTPLHPDVVLIRGEAEDIRYDVGVQWCVEDEEVCAAAANAWVTADGGAHLTGFRGGYVRAAREAVREWVPGWRKPRPGELGRGLTAVVSVWVPPPRLMFQSQHRARLNTLEAEGVVRSAVHHGLREHFAANRELADRVVRSAAARAGRK
jgi:DNA gyrase/topoisomerase IV subunit B